jgi:hypothetical protein
MASATVRRCTPGAGSQKARSEGRSTRRGERRRPLANRSSRDGTETRRDHHRDPKKSLGAARAVRHKQPEERREQMNAVSDLTSQVGVVVACYALAIPRSSFYRSHQEPSIKIAPAAPPTPSPRALSKAEQSVVRDAQ